MDKDWVVRGQHNEKKDEVAKQFRREMTHAEKVLWNQLRRNQLDGLHFRRQKVIDGYIADFYCHAAGLVVEVDGAVHRTHIAEDRERERVIGLRGLRVIRFTNDRILHDLSNCLAEIQAAARNIEAPR
jgi:very-short-patch-repair endonuclease